MDSFYVVCAKDGRVEANAYSDYERGYIQRGALQGQSLLDCKICGRASHLVFTKVQDEFEQCALRWQYAVAVTVKGNVAERYYAEVAQKLYATSLIPSMETLL